MARQKPKQVGIFKTNSCGCVMIKSENIWTRYKYCQAHEPKHTKHTPIFGRRREIFK